MSVEGMAVLAFTTTFLPAAMNNALRAFSVLVARPMTISDEPDI